MFFILSKILSFCITPIIWVIALFLIALFSKNARRKKYFFIAGIITLLFFSNSFILDETMRLWEIPATPSEKLDKYDVGIVLGGMTDYDIKLKRLQFQRSGDRLFQAIELYKKGIIQKILISGGSGSILHPDILEASLLKNYLVEIGIPQADILVEDKSKNTHENALFSKAILEQNSVGKKYLLITSAFHMRRALGCFQKQGISVVPYSTDRYSGPIKWEFDYLFIPDASTFNNWNVLLHEMVGFFTYKIVGYD
ncbi:MAG: YdcF family protein [Bacteroidia bacterium]